jgi:hypothetical protein
LVEHIVFESRQRWTDPFNESLFSGPFGRPDASERAAGSVSGLVLTGTLLFLNERWADLADVTVSVSGEPFTLNGRLLLADALTTVDPSAVLGTEFGTFALMAPLSGSHPVPTPNVRMVEATADGGTTATITDTVTGKSVGSFHRGECSSRDTTFGGDSPLVTLALSAADRTVATPVKTFPIGSGVVQISPSGGRRGRDQPRRPQARSSPTRPLWFPQPTPSLPGWIR